MTSEAKEPSEAAMRAARRALTVVTDKECDAAECGDECGLNFCRLDVGPVAAAIDTAVQAERDALVQYLTDLDDFTESIVGGLREAIKRGEHVSPTPDPPTPGGSKP